MLIDQFDIVQQANEFLSRISDADYRRVSAPHFSASAGMHMRHILDHYQALQQASPGDLVDYNRRNRGCACERERDVACEKWQQIQVWLAALTEVELNGEVTVVSDFRDGERCYQSRSTLGRELAFVAGHAIHHFALINIMASLQGIPLPASFGIAPATLWDQRRQA